MLNMDPPEHTRVRQIVQRGFTPRAIRALEDALRGRARTIVEERRRAGRRHLRLRHRGRLRTPAPGHRRADRHPAGGPRQDLRLVQQDDRVRRPGVRDHRGGRRRVGHGAHLVRDEHGRRPQGVPGQGHRHASWSPPRTRATSPPTSSASSCSCWPSRATRPPATPSRHGMHAFLTHPDQWELYKRERPATAAEEIVRWATPVVSFQRTATQDTELGGQQIKKGDRVGIFYSSANNDPEVFDRPDSLRHHPRPQPPPRLRRRRPALLPRQVPGRPGDRPDLQRHRRRHARPPPGRRPAPAALGLAQRHQGAPGQRQLTHAVSQIRRRGHHPPFAPPPPPVTAREEETRQLTCKRREFVWTSALLPRSGSFCDRCHGLTLSVEISGRRRDRSSHLRPARDTHRYGSGGEVYSSSPVDRYKPFPSGPTCA